jgi:hypothetical protein
MCRMIAIDGSAGKSRTISKASIEDSFCELELSMGGDGNGMLWKLPRSKEWRVEKGLKFSAEKAAGIAYRVINSGGKVLYHSRKVSVGWLDDSQCHPHRINGRKFSGWLTHNGTWHDGVAIATYLGLGSDTQALARVIGKFGLDESRKAGLFPSRGAFFLVSDNGDVRVIVANGDMVWSDDNGHRIWSSEPVSMSSMDWKNVANGDYHLHEVPTVKVVNIPKAPRRNETELVYRRFTDPLYTWGGD